MEAYRQEIIIGAVLVYMVFCVLTGLWAMRRTKSSSDFFIAGRGLGPLAAVDDAGVEVEFAVCHGVRRHFSCLRR